MSIGSDTCSPTIDLPFMDHHNELLEIFHDTVCEHDMRVQAFLLEMLKIKVLLKLLNGLMGNGLLLSQL